MTLAVAEALSPNSYLPINSPYKSPHHNKIPGRNKISNIIIILCPISTNFNFTSPTMVSPYKQRLSRLTKGDLIDFTKTSTSSAARLLLGHLQIDEYSTDSYNGQ